jgi:hypothetical protein
MTEAERTAIERAAQVIADWLPALNQGATGPARGAATAPEERGVA